MVKTILIVKEKVLYMVETFLGAEIQKEICRMVDIYPRQEYRKQNHIQTQGVNEARDVTIKYQICGKRNHTAMECFNRFNHSF